MIFLLLRLAGHWPARGPRAAGSVPPAARVVRALADAADPPVGAGQQVDPPVLAGRPAERRITFTVACPPPRRVRRGPCRTRPRGRLGPVGPAVRVARR